MFGEKEKWIRDSYDHFQGFSLASKVGNAFARCLYELCVLCARRKARRRDKELCADEPKLYLEESVLENKLPDITFRTLIELPSGLDYNEWLASHSTEYYVKVEVSCDRRMEPHVGGNFHLITAIAIFDNVNLMYGTISEFCTATGCPDMVGPGLR